MVNKDTVRELIKELSKKIRQLNKENSYKMNDINKERTIIEQTLGIINSSIYDIDLINIKEIAILFSQYKVEGIDDENVTNLLSDMDIPIEIAKGVKENVPIKFNDSELKIIEEFKNHLLKVKELVEQDITRKKEQVQKQNSQNSKYNSLYDKLRQSETTGRDIFTPEEIDLMMEFIEKWPDSKKKEILKYVNELSNAIFKNISQDTLGEEDNIDAKPIEMIDKELIIDLFKKNGFPVEPIGDVMPQKVLLAFQTRCNYSKLIDIMTYLISTPEYRFLYAYATKKNYIKLFKIFRYSSVDILERLRLESIQRNVRLEEIFEIEGVYKHGRVKNDSETIDPPGETDEYSVTGVFDNYLEVAQILDNYSAYLNKKWNRTDIDLYQRSFNTNKNIFCNRPEKIEHNCNAIELYGLSNLIIDNRLRRFTANQLTGKIPYFFKDTHFLVTTSLVRTMDLIIESGDKFVDYACRYQSRLEKLQTLYNGIRTYRRGGQVFNASGRMLNHLSQTTERSDDIFDDLKGNLAKQIINSMPTDLKDRLDYSKKIINDTSDSTINKFDQFLEQNNRYPNMPVYNINGTLVSANKFRRNWELINKYKDVELPEEEKILYALVYPGTYEDEDVRNLQQFVNNHEYNGGQRIV